MKIDETDGKDGHIYYLKKIDEIQEKRVSIVQSMRYTEEERPGLRYMCVFLGDKT